MAVRALWVVVRYKVRAASNVMYGDVRVVVGEEMVPRWLSIGGTYRVRRVDVTTGWVA
jgi:hypothetical protein